MSIEQRNMALIMVDVQNDFCPGGSLAVKEGNLVVPVLNGFVQVGRDRLWTMVATRDFHPSITSHFDKWPRHCIQGTKGAQFHQDLDLAGVEIFSKGMGETEDAYSGFDARNAAGLRLEGLLKGRKIEELIVGGLATDYCVRATVLDGLKLGYGVNLLSEGIRSVDLKSGDGVKAIEEMVANGAVVRSSRELLERLKAA